MLRIAAGQAARPSDEFLAFARQLGLGSVHFNTPELEGDCLWEVEALRELRARCESYGLKLEAIENLPKQFYLNAMLGRPGRDAEIENVAQTIINMGIAGIPVLGYDFIPQSVWRTALDQSGRGGATVSVFDGDVAARADARNDILVARRDLRDEEHKDSWQRGAHIVSGLQLSAEEMWENYRYFIAGVLPAAEEAGVRLALHPDDPPVPALDGVARIFTSIDALRQADSIADSDAWGLDLCLGTISAMGGQEAVLEAIDWFGPRQRIVYVHMRDVDGVVPHFREAFLGDGNYDPVTAMRHLIAAGFDGFLIDDHTPQLVNDSPYGHRGRAHAIGFMQGIMATLEETNGG